MGLCSKQSFIFEIFSQESKHDHTIGENTLHFPSWSFIMSNIVQIINPYYGWLEKLYKEQFYVFSSILLGHSILFTPEEMGESNGDKL